jgi:hypothetical protein
MVELSPDRFGRDASGSAENVEFLGGILDEATPKLPENQPPAAASTGGSTTVPCAACGSTEPPDERGLCPAPCRCFRVGNTVASVHNGRAKLNATDYAIRDALLERLFAERGGREQLDIVAQLRVEDYATAVIQRGKVTQKLEAYGSVSEGKGNARASLVNTYKIFSERVERLAAELPPPLARPAPSTERGIIERVIIDPHPPREQPPAPDTDAAAPVPSPPTNDPDRDAA